MFLWTIESNKHMLCFHAMFNWILHALLYSFEKLHFWCCTHSWFLDISISFFLMLRLSFVPYTLGEFLCRSAVYAIKLEMLRHHSIYCDTSLFIVISSVIYLLIIMVLHEMFNQSSTTLLFSHDAIHRFE